MVLNSLPVWVDIEKWKCQFSAIKNNNDNDSWFSANNTKIMLSISLDSRLCSWLPTMKYHCSHLEWINVSERALNSLFVAHFFVVCQLLRINLIQFPFHYKTTFFLSNFWVHFFGDEFRFCFIGFLVIQNFWFCDFAVHWGCFLSGLLWWFVYIFAVSQLISHRKECVICVWSMVIGKHWPANTNASRFRLL